MTIWKRCGCNAASHHSYVTMWSHCACLMALFRSEIFIFHFQQNMKAEVCFQTQELLCDRTHTSWVHCLYSISHSLLLLRFLFSFNFSCKMIYLHGRLRRFYHVVWGVIGGRREGRLHTKEQPFPCSRLLASQICLEIQIGLMLGLLKAVFPNQETISWVKQRWLKPKASLFYAAF